MFNSSWAKKYNLKMVSKVVSISWDGVELPLSPSQVTIMAQLLSGPKPVEFFSISRGSKCVKVLISQMRGLLKDVGFPLTISKCQGQKGYAEYAIIEINQSPPTLGVQGENGGDCYEYCHPANSSSDRLQDDPLWPSRPERRVHQMGKPRVGHREFDDGMP